METPAKINIATVIDNSRLGAFQWGLFLLCGLCLIMDGFDLQAIGYVAPALVRDWKIPGASLGPVFSAALVASSKEPAASKRLIAFLASEDAKTAIKKSGMESTKSRGSGAKSARSTISRAKFNISSTQAARPAG